MLRLIGYVEQINDECLTKQIHRVDVKNQRTNSRYSKKNNSMGVEKWYARSYEIVPFCLPFKG